VLRIRLQRLGRKGRPDYRIVLAEHARAVKGKIIESLGYYHPLMKEDVLKIDMDRFTELVKNGARPTNTIARLLMQQGVKGMERFVIEMKDKKVKNPKEEAAVAPAPEAPAPEAPAPEAPAPEEAK